MQTDGSLSVTLDGQKWLAAGLKCGLHKLRHPPHAGPTYIHHTCVCRFTRKQDYAAAMVHDGGTTYTPSVCTGNWVEERAEKVA